MRQSVLNGLSQFSRVILLASVMLTSAAACGAEPAAKTYPSKAVTLVVPFPPGGSTYFTAEVLAKHLGKALGQEFILETQSGNYGFTAVESMLEDTDGYRLMVGNVMTNSTSPVFHSGAIDFDYAEAVLPVSRLADFPFVIMTGPSFPADSLQGLLEHLRSTTGKLTYGTDFPGSVGDLYMMDLAKAGGLELQYLVTNGAEAIFSDLVEGKTDIAVLNVATATRKAGQYKPLAVTSAVRLDKFPTVPTLNELDVDNPGINLWQGLFAPSAMPAESLRVLEAALADVLASPQVSAEFAEVDAFVTSSKSAAEFQQEVIAEMAMWEQVMADVKAIKAAE